MRPVLILVNIVVFLIAGLASAGAQRGVRAPGVTPSPAIPGPALTLPAPRLDDTLTLPAPVPAPVIVAPPPARRAAPPDAGMCCPCAGSDECSDHCCLPR